MPSIYTLREKVWELWFEIAPQDESKGEDYGLNSVRVWVRMRISVPFKCRISPKMA